MSAGRSVLVGVALIGVALWFVLGGDASDEHAAPTPMASEARASDALPQLPAPVAPAPEVAAEVESASLDPEPLAIVASRFPRDFLIVEVVSKADGVPIPDAHVRVRPASDADGADVVRGATDAAGRCELAAPLGRLWLVADVPGAWYGSAEHLHRGGEEPAVVRVEVLSLTAVHGRVSDPDGAPLEDVRVSNMVSDVLDVDPVFTDTEGLFAFRHFKVDVGHRLKFERAGYGGESRHLTVRHDGNWRILDDGIDGPPHPAPVFLEIVMSPARVILGRVVDSEGRGLPDIEVRASGMIWTKMFGSPDEATARTDEHGAFELLGTRVDIGYIVRADVPGLGIAMQYAYPGETRVDLGALPLREFVTLSGRVVDASGQPAGGPQLQLFVTGLTSFAPELQDVKLEHERARELIEKRVGLDGRFAFDAPAIAELDLQIRGGARAVQRHAPDLSRGSLDMGDLRLEQQALHVEGRLLDADGAPLAGRTLEIGDRPHARLAELETAADGSFGAWLLNGERREVHIELRAEAGWVAETWDVRSSEFPVTLSTSRAGE